MLAFSVLYFSCRTNFSATTTTWVSPIQCLFLALAPTCPSPAPPDPCWTGRRWDLPQWEACTSGGTLSAAQSSTRTNFWIAWRQRTSPPHSSQGLAMPAATRRTACETAPTPRRARGSSTSAWALPVPLAAAAKWTPAVTRQSSAGPSRRTVPANMATNASLLTESMNCAAWAAILSTKLSCAAPSTPSVSAHTGLAAISSTMPRSVVDLPSSPLLLTLWTRWSDLGCSTATALLVSPTQLGWETAPPQSPLHPCSSLMRSQTGPAEIPSPTPARSWPACSGPVSMPVL